MQAQIFQLKTEIKNPETDRRSKDWHKQPVIPAGMRFIVRGDTIMAADHRRYQWTHERSELGKLILTNSEVVPPVSVREIKVVDADYDYDGDGILEALLKMGKLTRQDFAEAKAFMDAEDAEAS